jgi:hypothetical protein
MPAFSKSLMLGVALIGVLLWETTSSKGLRPETKELKLKSGAFTLIRKDSVKNESIINYRLFGNAGQTLVLRISSRPFGTVVPVGNQIQFGDGQPIALAYDGIERWTVKLTRSGDYFFSVRTKCPSKKKVNFTLAVSLGEEGQSRAGTSLEMTCFSGEEANHTGIFANFNRGMTGKCLFGGNQDQLTG